MSRFNLKLTFFVPCLNLAYEVKKLTVVVNALFKLVKIFIKQKKTNGVIVSLTPIAFNRCLD